MRQDKPCRRAPPGTPSSSALAQWGCTPVPGSWRGTRAGCGCDGHQARLPILQQPHQKPCALYLYLLQYLTQEGHQGLALLPTQGPQAITSHFWFSFSGAGSGAQHEQQHPSKGKHIKNQGSSKRKPHPFPEERLYSTKHSN